MALTLIDFYSGSSGGKSNAKTYYAGNGLVLTSTRPVYTNNGYYYMEYLFNGYMGDNAYNYWMTDSGSTSTSSPDYLTFDLTNVNVLNLKRIQIWPRSRTRDVTYSNYKIQYSFDGGTWYLICDWTNGNYNGWRTYDLDIAKPKYVRFSLCRKGSWGQHLAEIQMFHDPSIAATGVTVSPTSADVNIGSTLQITATVFPTNASNKNVSWLSNNPFVATVDSNGLVTAIGVGTATITATTQDGGYTATCSVAVYELPTCSSITNSGTPTWNSSFVVYANQVRNATRVLFPTWTDNAGQDDLIWHEGTYDSANDRWYYVINKSDHKNELGNYTIHVYGVSIANTSHYIGSTNVVIAVPVTSVCLNKTSTTLPINGTEQLTVTVSPSNATEKRVTWSSSDTTVAIVGSTGKITANVTKAGSCTITATTLDGGFTATCNVSVYIPVTSVSLNKSSTTINKGESETLVATIQPSNATNRNVNWSSSNPDVVAVDANGKVSALTAGTARITITTQEGNKTAYCDVTVYVAVTGITLNSTEITVEKGGTYTLLATVSPSDASDKRVAWYSDNPNIATVDASGKVTGLANGTAIIVANTVDGSKTATCTFHVHVAVMSIALTPNTADLHLIGKLQLTATVYPDDATVKDIIWSIDCPELASVDAEGLLTAIASGMVTVTATTVEGNFKATSRINIYQPINDKLMSFGVSSLYSRNKDVIQYSIPTVFKVINSNNLPTCFSVIQPYTQDGDKYGRNILTEFAVSKFSRLVGRFKADKRPVTGVRLEPIKDSSINDILDTVTFGQGLEMLVGYHAPTDEIYRSFIQFDMSSIPLKSNNIEILSAKLSLYVVGTHPAMTVEVMNVTEDWFEYWIVWFNRPDTEDTYVKTFHIPDEEGWIELDFQEILCGWCGESKEFYGFVIQSTDEARDAYIRLYTRESEFSPYLVLTYRDHEAVTHYWSDVWTNFTVRQKTGKNLHTHFKMRQTGKTSLGIRFSVVRSSGLTTHFKVKQKPWYAENLQTNFTVKQRPWYAENLRTTFTIKQKPRVPADYDKKTEFTVWYTNTIPTRFKAIYRSEFDTYTEFDIYYGKDIITTFKAKGPERSSIATRFTVREAAAVFDTFTLFDVVYAKPLRTSFKACRRGMHDGLTQFAVRKGTEYDKATRFKIRVDRNNGLVTNFTVVRRMKAYAFIM